MDEQEEVVCCPVCGSEDLMRFKTVPYILCTQCRKIISLKSKSH